jgi:spore coat polysaccharide biosynthesis protein SpsF
VTRIGIVTQARTTSTRLPGKVLIEVAGKTLLEHHLDRLDTSGLAAYVATTVNAADDPIVEISLRRGLGFHRGSEQDVLSRFAGLVEEQDLDVVVRVTSDCPLIDGRLIRAGVDEFVGASDPWLYLSNGIERSFPRGMDFEVFSAEALLDAAANATDPAHREHVTPYLYTNGSGRITLRHLTREPDASSYRVTLDTPEDLEVIRALIEQYDALALDVDQIIDVLDHHPELVSLNAHVEQKKLGQ